MHGIQQSCRAPGTEDADPFGGLGGEFSANLEIRIHLSRTTYANAISRSNTIRQFPADTDYDYG